MIIERDAFACSCGEEGKQLVNGVWQWFHDTYVNIYPDWPHDCHKHDLTLIVSTLAGRFNAFIRNIPCDPGGWSAVCSEQGRAKEQFSTAIQCDRIEDGFVYTLKAYYDHFGPDYNWYSEDDEDE